LIRLSTYLVYRKLITMDQIDYTNIVLEQLAYDFLTEEERTKLENDMSDESFEKEYYDDQQDIGVKPKVGSVMLG
jgi:hypothetical protein